MVNILDVINKGFKAFSREVLILLIKILKIFVKAERCNSVCDNYVTKEIWMKSRKDLIQYFQINNDACHFETLMSHL